MIELPSDRKYSTQHVWLRLSKKKNNAELGLTEDMVETLGEVISIDLPMPEDELEIDNNCVFLHLAGNRIEPIRTPLTGRVLEINRALLKSPEQLHLHPYEQWLFRMEYDEEEELDMLMDGASYSAWLDEHM